MDILHSRRDRPTPVGIACADIEFMLGGCHHGVLHIKVTIVGIHRPCRADLPRHFGLDARIPYFARVLIEHTRPLGVGQRQDDVLAVNIKDIQGITQPPAEQLLRERPLVTPQALGAQVGVLRREEVHLSQGRIAIALIRRQFHLDGVGQVDGDTRLRHPRNARQRMVIDPHTRIERHPRADMLAEIQIARHLVYSLVNQRIRLPLTLTLDIDVSRPPAESEVVHPKGQAVATEHLHTLVRRHARHIVVGIETVGTGTRPRGIAVVDIVMPEIIEAAHRTRGALVAVADRKRSHAARDRLVGILERLCDRARLRGIEMRHIDIGGKIPLRREIVAQLGIAAVLLERHVRTVAVGAVVRSTDHGGNAALVYSIGSLGLDRVVRPVACMEGGMDALLGLASNDIDHSAHGIRAVQHRGGATQDLHPLRHKGLVGVGDRMPHQPHILRVTIDQHHQLPRAAAQTAQGDST